MIPFKHIDSSTILVGHTLPNNINVLGILHSTVINIAILTTDTVYRLLKRPFRCTFIELKGEVDILRWRARWLLGMCYFTASETLSSWSPTSFHTFKVTRFSAICHLVTIFPFYHSLFLPLFSSLFFIYLSLLSESSYEEFSSNTPYHNHYQPIQYVSYESVYTGII